MVQRRQREGGLFEFVLPDGHKLWHRTRNEEERSQRRNHDSKSSRRNFVTYMK